MALKLLFRTAHGNLPADIPDKATQLSGDSRDNFVVMNAAGSQPAKAGTQPNLGFPRDRDEVLRLPLEPWLQRFANSSSKPAVPGGFDQDASDVCIAGLGESAAVSCRSAGVLTGDETEISHQLARMRESAQITEFSDDGHGGQEVDGTQRHQRMDYRQRAPRLNLRAQSRFQALDALSTNMYGQPILCEGDVVRGICKLNLGQKQLMGRSPPPAGV